jgi:hypothetical protein
MADTTTTNLSLTKPEPGASVGTWGTKLNADLDSIDGVFAAAGTGTSVGLNVGSGKTLNVDGTLDVSGGTLTLAAGQIGTADLATDAVTNAKIADAAVDTAQIADSAVTDAKITGVLTKSTTGSAASLLDSASLAAIMYSSGKWTVRTLSGTNLNLVAADFEATSDRNLKTNFHPVEDALELIKQVKIHRYQYKDSGLPGIGVIAQELADIIPEAVSTDTDPLTVRYNYLFSVLVQAVQELAEKVENGSPE